MSRIDLPDEADASNVISIEVVRDSVMLRRMRAQCTHRRVTVDVALASLTCRDCKAALSPMEWIAASVEWWGRIERLSKEWREASAKLDERKRCRCQHCGKVTGITREAQLEIVRERAARDNAGGET